MKPVAVEQEFQYPQKMNSGKNGRNDGSISTSPPLRKGRFGTLRIVASLAMIGALFFFVDAGSAFRLLQGARPEYVAAAVALSTAQILLGCVRWRLFGRALGLRATFADYVRGTYLSLAVAQVTPSSLIGEAARIRLFCRAHSWKDVLASIVLDRLSVVAATLALGLAALISLAAGTGFALAASVLVLGGCAALVTWAGRRAWGARFVFDLPVLRYFLFHRDTRGHHLLSLLVTASLPVNFYLCARALGIDTDFVRLAGVFPLVLVATLLPVSFGGWGLREWSAVVVLTPLGLSGEQVTTISLLFGLCSLAAALPGLAAFAAAGGERVSTEAGVEKPA